MASQQSHTTGGFKLFEPLGAVAIIAQVARMAISSLGGLRHDTKKQKLSIDVRTPHFAMKTHQAFGGSLEGITREEEVLQKLNSGATEGSSEETAGLWGAFVTGN